MLDNNIYVSVVEKDSPKFSCEFTTRKEANDFITVKQNMGHVANVITKADGFYLRNSYLSNF